jgi:hypothetical protein
MVNRWLVAAAAAAFAPAIAAAQAAPIADSIRVVRAIELHRFSVFDSAEAKGFLARMANRLHVTTRPSVVHRELLFQAGKPYDSAEVAETQRNLRSLGIFRRVAVDSARTDSGLVLRVTTADGWSTRPEFRFKNSGSSVQYTLSVVEVNFLGTATLASLRYSKDPDRSSVTTGFRQSRLLAGRVGLALQYSHLSDGDLGFVSLAKPYFSLSGRSAWSAYFDVRSQRILRFFDGSDVAAIALARRYWVAAAAGSWAVWAGPRGYLRAGVNGQIRRDDYADELRPDTLGHTVTGALGAFLQWRRARFLVSRGLLGFAREEDVDISTVVGVGVNFTPRGFGYPDDGVVPYLGAVTGFGNPHRFVQLLAIATGRYTDAGLDSGSVHLSATAFLRPGSRHLATVFAGTGWKQRPAPGAEFDLGGLGIGPRVFRQHSFTGNQAFFTTAEYRWTATEDFLKLTALGLAGFVDYGGAWYRGSAQRTGVDFGVGLRFGMTRATDVQTSRVDLAYHVKNDSQKGGWRLSVGHGFAFPSSGRLDQ